MGRVIVLGIMLCGFGTSNSQQSQTNNNLSTVVLKQNLESNAEMNIPTNAASDDDCDDVI